MILILIGILSVFIVSGLVILIAWKNGVSDGAYQVYWTTENLGINFKKNTGLFQVRADSLEEAKKLAIEKLKENYQEKRWFTEVKFYVKDRENSDAKTVKHYIYLSDCL